MSIVPVETRQKALTFLHLNLVQVVKSKYLTIVRYFRHILGQDFANIGGI